MSKRQVIILLGVAVIFLPFLGFTLFWNKIISMAIGLLVVGIAYAMVPSKRFHGVVGSNSQSNAGNHSKVEVDKGSDLPFADYQSGSGKSNSI